MNVQHPMMIKMARALKQAGGMFDLTDIQNGIKTGNMQGHVEGDSWAVTQVHDWPKCRTVNVLVVVGDLKDALKLEEVITDWAKHIGAKRVTALGRDGWWEHRTPGWEKMGTLYSKDI